MVNIPTINKCCCCVPLRLGSLIIGVFNLVISLGLMFYLTWVVFHTDMDENEDEENRGQRTKAQRYYVLFILTQLLWIVFSVVQLLVVWKRWELWLFCVSIAYLVINLLTALWNIAFNLIHIDYFFIAVIIVATLLHLYFNLVLWSYYVEVRDEDEEDEESEGPDESDSAPAQQAA